MVSNSAAADALDRAEAAAKRVDEWRSHLLKLSSGSMAELVEQSFLGRELRAAAAVATMAELEAMLRDMLIGVSDEINSSLTEVRELVPSLRSLASHALFQSLADSPDSEKQWKGRLAVTQLDGSQDIARLPGRMTKAAQPPLDGRTIQSRHLSLIWEVLGLPDPVPSALVVASLKKLTQIRNDVAHRNVDIYQVFSEAGRTARELAKYLDDIVLLILHIGNEWASYVSAAAYRATLPTPP